MNAKNNRRGFTIMEIIGVLVIIGILGRILIPNIPIIKRMGEDSQMKAKAIQLNTAMTTYMTERTVRTAIKTWTTDYTVTGEAIYLDLKPYIEMPATSLAGFLVEGYTVTFPADPRGEVTVTDPDGKPLEYK